MAREDDEPRPVDDATELDEHTGELERYERQFDAIFEDPKMLVALLDPDGTVRRVNHTAMGYIDADHDEIADEPFWESPWWATDARDDLREWIDRAAVGEYVEYEREHASSGDGRFTVSGTIRPVTNDEGTVVSLIASAHDITERKRRERELEQFEILVEEMLDIVTIIDEDGRMLYQTPSVERILGYEPNELEGEFALEYVHPDDGERVIERLAELAERPGATTERIEYRMRHADGSWRWLESTGSNPFEDALDGFLINSRDVTERKRRERELERTNDQLERFASIVSHDLRNPLNVLAGSLERAEATGDPEPFDHCREAVDRMERLIDDLLTLTRQGEQVDSVDAVDLRRLAEDCWRTVETDDSTLQFDSLGWVRADESRCRQLLENLFRNAIDHGDEGITVTVGGLEDGFYVGDDGPGIPPSERDRVFENGYSTATDGTGLGLSIVTEIAEAHGWQARVTEGEHGGARFEFTGVRDGT